MSIEQTYQKKTQLEHILLRPDTYIGSVEYTKAPMWVYDVAEDKLVFREISYVPGLYKIFDEILVNAADNKQRDQKMKLIKVNIDKAKNEVSVYNDGKGIPVEMHKVEKKYVPELIFGTLLTSSNYNDDERKTTGGRNGYGAKLCNVFSTKFTVETSSREYKRKFKQTWVNSMTKQAEPTIEKSDGDDFTKVTFSPDLKLFKMRELDDDIIALMSKRAYDVAGTSKGVTVYLNGNKLPCRGFKEYVEQYTNNMKTEDGNPVKVVFDSPNDRWEIALLTSDSGNFQQVSFVNSINTIKGGTHVDLVANQVANSLNEIVKKKQGKNGFKVTNAAIKNHMFIFVNALIENPAFDSQTKETLTVQAKSFGSTCSLGEKFMKEVQKSGIIDAIMSWVNFKQEKQKDKAGGKKMQKLKGVPKLEDANDAGTKNSRRCTLILTEGDSAKTLAVAGIGVVGRDHYGVFPLRGKLLNVREAPHKQIMDNVEIQNMIKIIGLKYTNKYENDNDLDTLRYGKIMIMADQDQDGSHIKGLVINFVHTNWPNLIRKHRFIEEFITPIVKATKKGQPELSFYSIPEYIQWRRDTDDWKNWKIKYYKGLGTSTSKEAKEYFSNMVRHRIPFKHGGENDDKSIELAFSKKKIEERKVWLTNWMEERKERRNQGMPEDYLYNKETRQISFSEFINKELILFSNTDNERSIPSLVDGLKPGQRKVLFTCFKRADKKEVKVAQLAGAVGEMSAYHHGEASLMQTIIGLAQNFVGANNINYLLPIGQFGTRLQGGKDSASARYIFTQLNPVTRTLFPSDDDNVLRFLYEENQRIEPEWYCPILPTVLINGAEGIGTGWSTKVPNYNPRDLVNNIRRLIKNEPFVEMKPWYKNFTGTIIKVGDSKYECRGNLAVIGDDTVEITELPIWKWTQNYKESVIEPMYDATDKQPQLIQDYKEYHTDVAVHFIIRMKPEDLKRAENSDLYQFFKMSSSINTSNMVLFDAAGCLRKFENVEEICREFFDCRRQIYKKRKQFLEGMLRAQSEQLSEKARFILMKINNQIHIENKRKANIIEQLVQHKFAPDPVKQWKELQRRRELELCGEANIESESEGENDTEKEETVLNKKVSDYDYLVGMAMWKLSTEDKDKLIKESNLKKAELEVLERKEWSDLYEEDLVIFLAALDKQEEKERKDGADGLKATSKKMKLDPKIANAYRRAPLVVERPPEKPKKERVVKPKTEKDDSASLTSKPKNEKKVTSSSTAKVKKEKKDSSSPVKTKIQRDYSSSLSVKMEDDSDCLTDENEQPRIKRARKAAEPKAVEKKRLKIEPLSDESDFEQSNASEESDYNPSDDSF